MSVGPLPSHLDGAESDALLALSPEARGCLLPQLLPSLTGTSLSQRSGHQQRQSIARQLKQQDPGLQAWTPDPGVGRAGPPEASFLGVWTAVSSPCPPGSPLCVSEP